MSFRVHGVPAEINTALNRAATIASDDEIGTTEIADDAVTAAKIAASAVTTAKIANLGVTVGKIAADAITATEIEDDAVTTVKILDANVTTAKIANDAVTAAKANIFVSTEQTATGSSQNVAHGLTGTPAAVLVIPTSHPGTPDTGAFDIAEGTHDGTNVVVTVTVNVTFKVLAWI